MAISCAHPRPLLNLPGYTPPRLNWQPPSFLSPNGPEQQRQLLEAMRGIYAELQKVAARRAVVPLQDDVMQLREGQIVTGVAAGQTLVLPQPVEDGAIGQISLLIDAVATPLTVVHPDGTIDTVSEPGLYEYGLGPEGEQAWVKPPGAIGGIRAISAGTQVATTGTVAFSNANGISFGLSGSSRLTASYTVPTLTSLVYSNANNVTFGIAGSTITASAPWFLNVTHGPFGATSSATSFINRLGLAGIGAFQWDTIALVAGGATLRANAQPVLGMVSHVGGNSAGSVSSLHFSNASNVTWSLSTGVGVATVLASVAPQTSLSFSNLNGVTFGTAGSTLTASVAAQTSISFSNANNVSFGLAGSTLTASATVASTADPQIGLVSHIGGNSVSSVTRLALSNASNVTWSLSTAANAATIIASVAAGGGGGITAWNVSDSATSQNITQLQFSNASGVSWSLSTGAGSVATIRASVGPTIVAVAGGTQSNSTGTVIFSNSNGISFGLSNSSVMTASYTVPTLTSLSFSNANNVTFGIAGSTLTASATVASSQGSIRITAGTTNNLVSNFSFSNGSGVSFGLAGSTITGSVDPEIGLLSHVGVNSVADATRLAFSNGNRVSFSLSTAAGAATLSADAADLRFGTFSHIGGNAVVGASALFFSNASNVTWNLSTAAGAVTVRASVDAAAGGGVALAAGTQTGTSGTVAFINSNAISFGMSGSTRITAGLVASEVGGLIRMAGDTEDTSTGTVDPFTGIASDTTAVRFTPTAALTINGITAPAADGQRVLLYVSRTSGFSVTFGHNTAGVSTNSLFCPSNRDLVLMPGESAWAQYSYSRWVLVTRAVPSVSHWRNWSDGDLPVVNFTNFNSSCRVFPLGVGPFPGNMTIDTLDIGVSGTSFAGAIGTSAWGLTVRGGLYTINNSTRLSLLNSFSVVASSTSIASTNSASRNALYAGNRWLTVGTGNWSSSPVLSEGVPYWMLLGYSVSGVGGSVPMVAWIGNLMKAALDWQGVVSRSQPSAIGSGMIPFQGIMVTSGPPTSIGTVNLESNTVITPNAIPVIQFRNGIFV